MKPSIGKITIWLAVPYYCSLVLPKQGLSRIYFLVQINLLQCRLAYKTMKVWPGQQAGRLARWFREQGAEGVLSSHQAPKYEKELSEEGIWFWQHPASDLDELISLWIDEVGRRDYCDQLPETLSSGAQRNHCENSHIRARPNAL